MWLKKMLTVLCTFLLLLGMNIHVFAQETELDAHVPKQHTVSIESTDGRIVADGSVCGKIIQIERHKEQVYRIIPDPGKSLESLSYDGVDVTAQVKQGLFKASKLMRDAALKAVYKDTPDAPDDRKYDIRCIVIDKDGIPVPHVVVDISGRTGTTDQNGKCKLGDIASGTHQVVILDENGKILSHRELRIDKAGGTKLILSTDGNGNPVIRPAESTKQIEVTLQLTGNDTVEVSDIRDITPKRPAGLPRTGDNSKLPLILLLLSVSGGTVLLSAVKRRKKNIDPMTPPDLN